MNRPRNRAVITRNAWLKTQGIQQHAPRDETLATAMNYLASSSATLWNLSFAFEPIRPTLPRHTTMIKAIMTAYSTAVGPSSSFRKLTTFSAKFFMSLLQARKSWFQTKPLRQTKNVEQPKRCTTSAASSPIIAVVTDALNCFANSLTDQTVNCCLGNPAVPCNASDP